MVEYSPQLPQSTVDLLLESINVYNAGDINQISLVVVFSQDALIGASYLSRINNEVDLNTALELADMCRKLKSITEARSELRFLKISYSGSELILIIGTKYHVVAELKRGSKNADN